MTLGMFMLLIAGVLLGFALGGLATYWYLEYQERLEAKRRAVR